MNDTIIVDFCDSDGNPSDRDEARAYAVTIQILPETPDWFDYNGDEYTLFGSQAVNANFNKYSDAMMKVMEHVSQTLSL